MEHTKTGDGPIWPVGYSLLTSLINYRFLCVWAAVYLLV